MRIIGNGEPFGDDITQDHTTIFLVGPSARGNQGIQSYRGAFKKALQAVISAGDGGDANKYVVFDPEAGNYDASKGHEHAQWELRALERSHVVVVGLAMNDSDMPGLTTRAEAGALFATRTAVVVYVEQGAHRCRYLKERAHERNLRVIEGARDDDTMARLARAVIDERAAQMQLVQSNEGRFNATNVRPIEGADPCVLGIEVQRIAAAKTSGSLYVWLPLLDTLGYGRVLARSGRVWLPHVATKRYCIVRTSFDGDADQVPPAATSIAGAFAAILSPDEASVLLVETRRGSKVSRGFPGGAVECNELDVDACVREVREELGVDIAREQMTLVGGYNQSGARKYGCWDGEDDAAPLLINDHFATFITHLPTDTKFTVQHSELASVEWFDVADVLAGNVEGVHRSKIDILRAATQPDFHGMPCKRVKTTKVVF